MPQERREDYKHLRTTLTILSIVAVLCTILGGVVSSLGFKRFGPPEQIALVATHMQSLDSAMNVRVSRLEGIAGLNTTNLQMLRDTVNSIKSDQRFNNYLLCVVVRKVEPNSAPDKCTGGR